MMEAYELLLDIDGIGASKAHALLTAFGNGRTVARKASGAWGEIADVDGFSRDSARGLFHEMTEAGVYCDLLNCRTPYDAGSEKDV